MKKTISILILAIMVLSITSVALAASLSNYTTTSSTGWIYYNSSSRGHRGQKSSTYYLDPLFYSIYNKNRMYDAADRWGYNFLTMERVTNQADAVCTVLYGVINDPLRVVQCKNRTLNSSGHINKADIVIDEGLFINSYTQDQHELILMAGIGGAYGLGAVTSGTRLMNWHGQYLFTGAELNGMKVLNHLHTHSSSSSTVTIAKYDDTQHKCSCSYCDTYFYENHTFSLNTCTKCGYRPVV